MPDPRVSLVITTHNRRAMLPRAVESVLGQTYGDFELLIWDDGSADGTAELLPQFARRDKRVRAVAAGHLGRSPALRAAIEATTGTYLGWVDDDDALHPTALAETVAVLDAGPPTVGWVYTDYFVTDAQCHRKGLGRRCSIPYSPHRLLVDFMTFHFRLIRRTAYDAAGGIDASFDAAEDYDLCLRLAEVSEVRHLPRPLYDYRANPIGTTVLKQVQQIEESKRAVLAAMRRRKLEDQFALDVVIESRFALRKK